MWWGLAAWGGCVEEPDFVPACVADRTTVEVAPPDGDFGTLHPGDPLFCGTPPQGGAPYTPWRFRFTGPASAADGVLAHVTATDRDTDELLGDTAVALGVVCANAGTSAGWFTAAEVHLRYEGHTVGDLDGRAAEIRFAVEPAEGREAPGAVIHEVVLDCP